MHVFGQVNAFIFFLCALNINACMRGTVRACADVREFASLGADECTRVYLASMCVGCVEMEVNVCIKLWISLHGV